MKNMLIVIMALAIVAAFMPKAEAADSAQLGLKVTFAAEDQDLKRVLEIKDNLVVMAEKAKSKFASIYVDRNGDGVVDYYDLDLNGDGVVDNYDMVLFNEAVEYLKDINGYTEENKAELTEILERRPDLKDYIVPVLAYADGVERDISHYLELMGNMLPVISIELEGPNPWVLEGVKLGEKRFNFNDGGRPSHSVKNTGNIVVTVDMGYETMIDYLPRPGLEQGPDTYITLVNDIVIPPAKKVRVGMVQPGNVTYLALTYGAPTALSRPVEGMGTSYEIRAYKAIWPIES